MKINTQQIKRSLERTHLIDQSQAEIQVKIEHDGLSGKTYRRVMVYGAPDQMQNIVDAAAVIGYTQAIIMQGSQIRVMLYQIEQVA